MTILKTICALAGASILSCSAFAQTAAQPSFEVASVKLLEIRGVDGLSDSPERSAGRISWITNLDLLLRYAFNLPDWRISRKDTDRSFYAIDATMDPSATTDQIRRMLQNLLIDRFKLASHLETRKLDGYVLAVSRNGTKLKDSAPGEPHPMPGYLSGKPPEAFQDAAFFSMFVQEGMVVSTLTGRGVSTRQLADALSMKLGTTVVDETGLTGRYYFGFKFGSVDNSPADPAVGTPLFTALQKELGLRMERRTFPTGVLVLDRLEPPSGN